MSCWAVVPAAGRGTRYGAARPKQFERIGGRAVVDWALDALLSHPRVAGAVIATGGDADWAPPAQVQGKPVRRCAGGAERQDSVLAALAALPDEVGANDLVLVHDAARPVLAHVALDALIDAALADPVGAILALPVRDTLKRADAAARIIETVPREQYWRAQTPQAFRRASLTQALEAAAAASVRVTDEAQALERLGHRPRLVEGREDNIKLTVPDDRVRVARSLGVEGARMRIGFGYDVHAFGEGDAVVLGGVRIPHARGVLAHSDGDVALHALCDALLGALALGDIGRHFPPGDPRFAGADSRELLRVVAAMVREHGYAVGNVDLTIVAEAPRVAPHVEAMRGEIAAALRCTPDRVSVKATTSERLGFTGRGEGLAAQAVALLEAAP